jgi:hypothetical protein
MMRLIMFALLSVLATGCGDKKTEPAATPTAEADRKKAAIEAENRAPVPPAPPAQPSKFQAEVDLTFTGAIENKLTGPVGICGATFIDGRLQGGNYGIRTDDLEFQVIAATDEELTSPKSVLNTKGANRRSFAARDTSKIIIDVAKGATIDVELKNIVGPETVKVTGTVTCGPDYRTR